MQDLIDRLRTALAGRYRIDREVGRGGMAIVFLAHDERHGRQVALKVLRPELAWSIGVERFLREIHIAAGLTHPHILPLFDSGEIAGAPAASGAPAAATAATHDGGPLLYYVMPYIASESLRDRLTRETQLPIDEAVAIARQVAAALAHAHAHGIVHRDIKPENILLQDGEALVADFGIARAVQVAAEERLSEPGVVLGSVAYMSPEQSAGADVDGRSDVYSLGCVLYEMLTGAPPFQGPTPQLIITRHQTQAPAPLRPVRATIGDGLESVVLRSLEKAPADRYRSARELADALGAAADPPSRRPAERPGRRPAEQSRRRTLIAGAAVAATAIGVAGAATLLRAPDAVPLDAGRIVVLPISGSGSSAGFAADATVALEAALNSTPELRGVVLHDTAHGLRSAARAEHAGFALVPRLVMGDSVRLVLTLHDMAAGTTIQRIAALGPTANGWQAGVRAASVLLPALLTSGSTWDLSPLERRPPAASAEFLLGERAYRNARFAEAQARFRAALEADSAFTLAAVRGALAALWADDQEQARSLAARALGDPALTPWHASIAAGIAAYGDGHADAAVAAFRRAITANPRRPEGWMALGEIYTHLLPRGSSPDSAAETAFNRALQVDSAFVPALPHLIEAAVRRGDSAGAAAMLSRLAASSPNSAELTAATLVVRCAVRPLTAQEWRTEVGRHPREVNAAAYVLSVAGLRRPRCAEAAWRAILAHDTTGGGETYHLGAVLGLHGVLVATGRADEARALVLRDTVLVAGNRRDLLLLHSTVASAPAEAGDDRESDLELPPVDVESEHSVSLWFYGLAQAHNRNLPGLQAGAAELRRRADAGGTPLDTLLAASLGARYLIATGDTAAAIAALEALRPVGDKTAIAWYPWASLAAERMLLAQLLSATGSYRRAHDVASTFDAPAPVIHLIYLPESLRLRERAARELGWAGEARRYRARIEALGRSAGPRGD